MKGRILVVDDSAEACELLYDGLTHRSFQVTWRTAASEALELLGDQDFDVVVTDLNMRGMNGIELCERVVANRPDIPVVVITAFGSMETAIAAIRAGAYDFIPKPFELDALAIALERAIQHRFLRAEVTRLRRSLQETREYEGLLGDSPAMRKVYDLLDRLADSDVSVLITGESGTGKERVARALHQRSRRRDGAFVAVNCAAVPEAILESELFGHVKGAFTDAKSGRTGLFVEASGGTLLLDEIGDMPLSLQPKLLRALQERVVRPVGGNTEVPFDVRLVASTNRDLETEIEERRFRRDLYFRINVVELPLPPLRTRSSDVLVLAQHFVRHFADLSGKQVTGFSPEASARLLSYAWPGNVRELQNCIERAVALTRYEEIAVEDLPERVQQYGPSRVLLSAEDPSELVSLEEVERRYILRVLEAVGGNKSLAAQVLNVDRKTLYRKLESYGVLNGGRPRE